VFSRRGTLKSAEMFHLKFLRAFVVKIR
jgi:hypothetical protein